MFQSGEEQRLVGVKGLYRDAMKSQKERALERPSHCIPGGGGRGGHPPTQGRMRDGEGHCSEGLSCTPTAIHSMKTTSHRGEERTHSHTLDNSS